MPKLLPILLLAFATGCDIDLDEVAGRSREQEDFQFTHDFKPGGKLVLENYNGSVEVTGWDQPKIEIAGTKYAPTRDRLHEIKIDISPASNGVTIRTIPPVDRTGNTGAKYRIRLPKQAILELVKTTNGAMRVATIDGSATLRTTNGSVRVSDVTGSVSASSTNGAVECIAIQGPVTVRTTNGRVKMEEVRGSTEASTSNGTILASMSESSGDRPMRFSTTNGSIELNLPPLLKNDVRASTTNGSIEVRMPSSANFQVSARTSGSSVRSDFAVVGEVSKKRIEGTVGTGGPLVDLSTTNGAISLQRSL